MSLVNHKLVVATAGRRVLSYDIREMNGPLDERGVGLKFNTSSVACMLGGEGQSSVGRTFGTSHSANTL